MSLNGSESGGGHSPLGSSSLPDPQPERNTSAGKKERTTVNPLIQFKQRILPLLIVSVLGCFGLSPTAQAQLSPAPDGGYAGINTAEGENTLVILTTGNFNTAIGALALFVTTT